MTDRVALRSAAVASLGQWARQWLPEGQAPLPPTSPLHRDSSPEDAEDEQAVDSTVLSLPERPRALDEAWNSFMARVQAPADANRGFSPTSGSPAPTSSLEIPSHAHRVHGGGGAELSPSPLALVAEAPPRRSASPLLRPSDGHERRSYAAAVDAKSDDLEDAGMEAGASPSGRVAQSESLPPADGAADLAQAERQRKVRMRRCVPGSSQA